MAEATTTTFIPEPTTSLGSKAFGVIKAVPRVLGWGVKTALGLSVIKQGADTLIDATINTADGDMHFAPPPPGRDAGFGEKMGRLGTGGPVAVVWEGVAQAYSAVTGNPIENNPLHRAAYASADFKASIPNGIYTAVAPMVLHGVGDVIKIQTCTGEAGAEGNGYVDPGVEPPIMFSAPQKSVGKPSTMIDCLNKPDEITNTFNRAAEWTPPVPGDKPTFVTEAGKGVGQAGGGVALALNPELQIIGNTSYGISQLKVMSSAHSPVEQRAQGVRFDKARPTQGFRNEH